MFPENRMHLNFGEILFLGIREFFTNQLIGELQERRSLKMLQNIRLMLLAMVHHNWRLFGSWRDKLAH
ncbi:hypothetical protein OA58_20055 [Microcystis aeruginosa NIES-88]|nr:hypothetical protein OA58_20055 [Microcystis aeruginosa NIES-88]